jgi:hypothetical protein
MVRIAYCQVRACGPCAGLGRWTSAAQPVQHALRAARRARCRRPAAAAPSAARTGFADAPADRAAGTSAPCQQLRRILPFQLGEMRFHLVLGLARWSAGCGGEPTMQAEHRGADAVDVGPRPQRRRLGIQLGRRKAGRVHRREFWAVAIYRLAGGAKVEQHRRAVAAQIDIGRFQVQVQQLIGVDFAQSLERLGEYLADERFADLAGL